MIRVRILCFVAAPLLLAAPARAQTSPENRAAADALYEESGTLMKAGRMAEACPKLETSQRLDPGVGTLLRLGYCYEHVGRTASAWSAYNDAEALARRLGDKRADDAASRARALEPKLSRLLITVVNSPPGLEVRRDGKPVDSGLWGTAVPVDPGEHLVDASAPGKEPWKGSVRIEAAPTTTTITVPMLIASANPTPDAQARPAPFWGGQRIAGVVVGVAGLATLGAALGVGAHAKSLYQDSTAHCLPNDPTKCYADGVSLRNQAYSAATVSTGLFVAGAAAFAGGLITFFTAPSRSEQPSTGVWRVHVQPALGVGGGSLQLAGSF